jgi:hypothetical protein
MTFRLRPDVDEADFVAADRRVQTEFALRQPGLYRRTTGRGDDGSWIVIDFWKSVADAEKSLPGWHHAPAPLAFMSLVDDATVETRRFEAIV